MDYEEALRYLDEHASYEKTGRVESPSLDNITRLMDVMASPQHSYPVIHVTGTNGKGSTTQIITKLLMAHGLTVGMYTSPHLERLNERISFIRRDNFDPVEIKNGDKLPSLNELAIEARKVADGIARALELVGLLTVEFFIGGGRDGIKRLYVNELAPRVHNSGHVTRQACTVSQFDALARILAGVPVVQPEVHRGAWCMGQLLGDVWLAQGRHGGALDLTAWKDFPDVVDVYVYGKRQARPNRKMGHYVVHADTPERAMERAVLFRQRLRRT